MVNKRRLVQAFTRLVSIDSESGHEREISDYLLTYLKSLKVASTRDSRFNILAKLPGQGAPLLLGAHMDTVTPGRGVRVSVTGDVITSAGDTILGADNKSTLAVILELLNSIKEDNIRHRPIEVLFTVNEERNLEGSKEFDYSRIEAKQGLIADIAQPLGTIVIASPYAMRFEVELTGRSGHTAFPEKARSVSAALGEILMLKQGYLDSDSICNIGIVRAGTVTNAVLGYAWIEGEVRSFDKRLYEKHAKEIGAHIGAIANKHGLEARYEVFGECPGYSFDPSDQSVRQVKKILSNAGLKPKLIRGFSASDANNFNTNGLTVVNIGDGSMRTHTVDESIKISDMMKLGRVFYSYITG